ncbi:hypothetical protein A2348_00260 [Candidatus Uhrbacteria bacterium RIFOXYB12_FULL_58_10]|uniref:Sucrose phosphatase-like domain-containing protein n=1 Tax=Candidatus Uhrbacteria bacterium RIFOXYB2_FULL_57_15 TaxID=1802422 RepID=A0A1F7W8E7_9BACT|nr:MAG: hypothetical protein A2348_00260 [Candidatus Uhrbacteria bacterium RIFOXYB12_FULL_58_10]OGL98658.1 MAG: hypothetical protein A2304_03070 [Candidatus Uhrbacteria bacterium RIFOXYB2_FULL_57_15]OGM00007.1 MAG: hypothetical protein A2501_02715 [Candidatus Uhrbacteria bacterium RIFOXYC12_FULL_57_11]
MLVLFDLDKTLIDVGYYYTDDGIEDAVRRAVSRGHTIGLNSDSPVPILLGHHRHLGMNGPIVAERGAVVHFPGSPGTTIPTGTSPDDEFVSLRDRILRRLTRDGDVEAILGDPSSIIRSRRFMTDSPRSVLLASALRTHSLHFAARIMDGKDYRFDMALLTRVKDAARVELECQPFSVAIDWDLNPEYAILILHASASRKVAGVSMLLARLGIDEAIMVGDGVVDNLSLPNVRQWAVGNAHPGYKAVCERIAAATFTSGAIELLDALR